MARVLTGDTKAEDLQHWPETVPEYVLERMTHLIPAEIGREDD